jgi:hypothetical protein
MYSVGNEQLQCAYVMSKHTRRAHTHHESVLRHIAAVVARSLAAATTTTTAHSSVSSFVTPVALSFAYALSVTPTAAAAAEAVETYASWMFDLWMFESEVQVVAHQSSAIKG